MAPARCSSPRGETVYGERATRCRRTVRDVSDLTLCTLGPADIPAASDALARGFDQEPGKLALVPDPTVRRAVIEMSASIRLREAARRGTAHAAVVEGEPAAVAVWVPPGVRELSVGGGVRFAGRVLGSLRTLAPGVPNVVSVMRKDVRGMIGLVRSRRRAVTEASEGPTWNLVLIATVPEHRGKGLARALLEHRLRRFDEDGVAAWLETTDPVNVAIYERFGFETGAHLEGPSWLPGLWVMRRAPATR
jgi:GNAT superfamily N-acetyltransferase